MDFGAWQALPGSPGSMSPIASKMFNFMPVKGIKEVTNTDNFQNIKEYIDQIDWTGEVGGLMFRKIVISSPSNLQWSVDLFEQSMAYIAKKIKQKSIVNVTIDSLYNTNLDGIINEVKSDVVEKRDIIETIIKSMPISRVYGMENLTQIKTALTSGTARIAYVGHSIVGGAIQCPVGATTHQMLMEAFRSGFSTKTLVFENFGIGGKSLEDYFKTMSVNGFSTAAASLAFFRNYWRSVLTTPGITWEQHVINWLPDLVVLQFDLNDSDSSVFATQLNIAISNMISGGNWAGKRPSIMLVTSHGSLGSPDVVRVNQRVIRGIADKYGIYVIDVGHLYDLFTLGVDCLANDVEYEFMDPSHFANQYLLTTMYDVPIGNAYTPTGTTIRNQAGAASPFKFLRKRLTYDGSIQMAATLSQSTSEAWVYYREDPTDVNYPTNTGKCYAIKVTATKIGGYYRASGSSSFILIAETNVTTALTSILIDVRYNLGRHEILANGLNGEMYTLNFNDFSYLGSGYQGIGITGTGGGYIAITQTPNQNSGCYFEFKKPRTVINVIENNNLFGVANDFSTHPKSKGGNLINHMASKEYNTFYKHEFNQGVKTIQQITY